MTGQTVIFMGRMKGIEPSTFGTTTRRSNQVSYIRQTYAIVAHLTGIG
jgi:hypothetical protein